MLAWFASRDALEEEDAGEADDDGESAAKPPRPPEDPPPWWAAADSKSLDAPGEALTLLEPTPVVLTPAPHALRE